MNKKITFPELIEAVATATETSKRTSEVFLKELFAVVTNSLVNGENVRIKNLGQFKLTEVGERKSVNVNTGEEMQIPSHTKVTFTPDKSLADAINMPFASFETVEISNNATEEELKLMSSTQQLPEKESQGTLREAAREVPQVAADSGGGVAEGDMSEESYRGDGNVAEVVQEPQPSDAREDGGSTEENAVEEKYDTGKDDAEVVEEEAKTHEVESDAGNAAQNGGDDESEDDAVVQDGETVEENSGRLDDLRRRLEERYAVPYRSSLFMRGFFWGIVTMLAIAAVAFYSYYLYNEENKAYNQAVAFANSGRGDEVARQDSIEAVVAAIDSSAVVAISSADTAAVSQQEVGAIAEEPHEGGSDEAAAVRYDTVTRSRYLTTMSREYYGDFRFWVYIYEENKGKIKDPNAIAPGTQVVIPPVAKYGIDKDDQASINRARALAVEILPPSDN